MPLIKWHLSFSIQLTDALEGKGGIPKQQAVELLTLLKTAELVAPKTDLLDETRTTSFHFARLSCNSK